MGEMLNLANEKFKERFEYHKHTEEGKMDKGMAYYWFLEGWNSRDGLGEVLF